MKKIIISMHPFDRLQNIYVYEDDNRLETIQAELGKVQYQLEILIKKYGVNHIDIAGPKKFSKVVERNLISSSLIDYSKLQINYI